MIELLDDAASAVRRVVAASALDGALLLLRLARRLSPTPARALRLVRPAPEHGREVAP